MTHRPRVAGDVGRLGALAVAVALPLAAVLLTGAVNGGYFPSEWGWPTLGFVLVCVLGRELIALFVPALLLVTSRATAPAVLGRRPRSGGRALRLRPRGTPLARPPHSLSSA